jgi:hypothetical protein
MRRPHPFNGGELFFSTTVSHGLEYFLPKNNKNSINAIYMKNKLNRPITNKERDTLLEVAEKNGPQWKALFLQAWESGRYFDLAGVTLSNCQHLYRLRNNQGVAWLESLNLDDLKKLEHESSFTDHGLGKSQRQFLEAVLENSGYWHPNCNFAHTYALQLCNGLEKRGILIRDIAENIPQPCFRLAISEEEARALIRGKTPREETSPPAKLIPGHMPGPYKVVQDKAGTNLEIRGINNEMIAVVRASKGTGELLALSPEMAQVLFDLVQLEDHRLRGSDMDLQVYRERWELMLGAAREIVSRLPIKGGE